MTTVKLEDVIDYLEFANNSYKAYFNKKKGLIQYLLDVIEMDRLEESEEKTEKERTEAEVLYLEDYIIPDEINADPDNFIPLPDRFGIDGYQIMVGFISSLEDDKLSDQLLSIIQGRGAFARFIEKTYEFGLTGKWNKYRYGELKDAAVQWCQLNNIVFN